MPAQIVPGEFCASYWAMYEVRGTDRSYIVTWMGGEVAPHCTCKAWQFAPWDDKSCKHTRYVWEHACMWNCQWFEGNTTVTLKPTDIQAPNEIPGSHCPNCDGPLVAVRIAV